MKKNKRKVYNRRWKVQIHCSIFPYLKPTAKIFKIKPLAYLYGYYIGRTTINSVSITEEAEGL